MDKNIKQDQIEELTSVPSDNDTSSNITLPEDEEDEEVMEMEDDDDDVGNDDDDDESNKENSGKAIVSYLGTNKSTAILNFRADGVINEMPGHVEVANRLKMTYKQGNSVCRLVRNLLEGHGLKEVENESLEYNICWMGSHVKPHFLANMQSYQRVNHFPRSFEITRKDKLYKNVQKMQFIKGFKNFDFIPQTFVLPTEFPEFSKACRDRSTWIVKPTSLSRGRGIFLTTNPDQCIGLDKMVACKYIPNPFLINGFKFDIRLYVAVTSFDPLVVYLYEEGLTRFATIQFDKSGRTITDTCMHLTNYSVNKRNNAFVSNTNSDVENEGSKWTLGALLRHLKGEGHDTTLLMMSIEDVIIKTMLSGENGIVAACKTFLNFKSNCFELFGFDILLDENLKPWVLEVNLSPSLTCDAPLDLKIKSNMLTDLFNLVGVECQDPTSRKFFTRIALNKPKNKMLWWKKKLILHQKLIKKAHKRITLSCSEDKSAAQTEEERRMMLRFKEEFDRRGNWVRLFPGETTLDIYGNLFTNVRPNNIILHRNLYPGRSDGSNNDNKSQKVDNTLTRHYQLASQRCQQYERSLSPLTPSSNATSLKVVKKNVTNDDNKAATKKSKDSLLVSEEVLNSEKQKVKVHSKVKQAIYEMEDSGRHEELRKILSSNGFNLSHVQARKVFTTYLRQMTSQSGSFDQKISDNSDAIIHLLRKVGGKLCHGFTFSEPRNNVAVAERRAIVESQLHKFLAQFDEETSHLEKHKTYNNNNTKKEDDYPNNDVFDSFLENASKFELELVFNLFTEQETNHFNSTNRKSPSNKNPSPKSSEEVKGQKRSCTLIEFCEALINRQPKHVRPINPSRGSQSTTGGRRGLGLAPLPSPSSSSLMSAFNIYAGFRSLPERPNTSMLDKFNFRAVDPNLSKTFEKLRIRIGSANPRLGSHPLDGSYKRISQSDGSAVANHVKPARNFSATTSKKDFPNKKSSPSATKDETKAKTDSAKPPTVKPFGSTHPKWGFKKDVTPPSRSSNHGLHDNIRNQNVISSSSGVFTIDQLGDCVRSAHKSESFLQNYDSDEEEFQKFDSSNHNKGNKDASSNQHRVFRAWYDSDQSREEDAKRESMKDREVMASLKSLSIKRSSNDHKSELTSYLNYCNDADLLLLKKLNRISTINTDFESGDL